MIAQKSRAHFFFIFRLDSQDVRTSKKMLDSFASLSCRTKANYHNVSPELTPKAERNVNLTGSFITQICWTIREKSCWPVGQRTDRDLNWIHFL